MSVKIASRVVNGVTVVTCSGPITLGESTTRFRNTLREHFQSGVLKLLLDLNQVTYIDSSGIGELVGAYTSAASAEARIKLTRVPAKIRELLQITRLVTVFEIFDDETEAIRSFQ